MPGYLTDYANNLYLDCLFGGVAFVPRPLLYAGLSLARPNKLGTVLEPSAGDYDRIPVVNSFDTFSAASGGEKSNLLPITFPQPQTDWGAILAVFVADMPIGGNVIWMAEPAGRIIVLAGDPAPSWAPGAMYFSHT